MGGYFLCPRLGFAPSMMHTEQHLSCSRFNNRNDIHPSTSTYSATRTIYTRLHLENRGVTNFPALGMILDSLATIMVARPLSTCYISTGGKPAFALTYFRMIKTFH